MTEPHAVERKVVRAASRQRALEAVAVVIVITMNLLFQTANRGTVKKATSQSRASLEALNSQLQGVNQRLDTANARVGQLEQVLVAAGVPAPPPLPPSTTSTARVRGISPPTTRRAVAGPGASTTTSTQPPAPTTTTTTTNPPSPPNTLPGGLPCPSPIPRC